MSFLLLFGTGAAVIGMQATCSRMGFAGPHAGDTVDVTGTHAPANGGMNVDDIKRAARDTEADIKETGRKVDGEESLGDKAANAKDRVGNAVEDVKDKVDETVDEASRDAAYEKGRADEMARR
jgi:hypothetical protein